MLSLSAATPPSLMISLNDQASAYVNGDMIVRPQARPGSISLLDIASTPVKAWHIDGVQCSVIGPPSELAISPDGRDILVSAAMQVGVDKTKFVPGTKITRLRFDGETIRRAGEIEVGAQPSGIRISRDGKHAWVALRAEGKIALLSLRPDGMSVDRTWVFATPADSIADIALSPDERTAFATLHESKTVLVFDADTGGNLSLKQRVATPVHPYHIVFFPDGNRALVGCTTGADVMCLFEKTDGGWSVREQVPTGRIPEGVFISPDGRWAAATCFDGQNLPPNPQNIWYNRPARLYIYAVQADGGLRQTQALKIDGVPQGAAFSADSRRLVATQFGPGNLAAFELKGGAWAPTGDFIELPGQPAALIATGN
ncbi:lactonase family protein [Termitidicoccus mucosus]